jgi:hypothetical protein
MVLQFWRRGIATRLHNTFSFYKKKTCAKRKTGVKEKVIKMIEELPENITVTFIFDFRCTLKLWRFYILVPNKILKARDDKRALVEMIWENDWRGF